MSVNKKTVYTPHSDNKSMTVDRYFDAPVADVWQAWTDADLLDQWWAPKPWKANTKSMDFREGGAWIYSMDGPDGSKQPCKVTYYNVKPINSFGSDSGFCDENGNMQDSFPVMHWSNNFTPEGEGTNVRVEINFDTEAGLQQVVAMGFKEGFEMGHSNLDELLASRK